jgi:hypothetical protein
MKSERNNMREKYLKRGRDGREKKGCGLLRYDSVL